MCLLLSIILQHIYFEWNLAIFLEEGSPSLLLASAIAGSTALTLHCFKWLQIIWYNGISSESSLALLGARHPLSATLSLSELRSSPWQSMMAGDDIPLTKSVLLSAVSTSRVSIVFHFDIGLSLLFDIGLSDNMYFRIKHVNHCWLTDWLFPVHTRYHQRCYHKEIKSFWELKCDTLICKVSTSVDSSIPVKHSTFSCIGGSRGAFWVQWSGHRFIRGHWPAAPPCT